MERLDSSTRHLLGKNRSEDLCFASASSVCTIEVRLIIEAAFSHDKEQINKK